MRGNPDSRWAAAGALLAVIATPSLAVAQAQSPTGEGPGFYLSGEAGGLLGGDDKIKGQGEDTHVVHDPAFGFLGATGFRFDNGLRVEFEGGYRRQDNRKSGDLHRQSSVDVINFGPNVLWDIRTGSRLTPYLGVGIGGALVGYNHTPTSPVDAVNEQDLGLAYQGILGIAYAVSDRLQLTADYRYQRMMPVTMKTEGGRTVDVNYHSHGIFIGLRWLFWPSAAAAAPPPKVAAPAPAPAPAPLPPPAPAPAPAPPATFMVYFQFDSASINAEAAQVIEKAAAAIKEHQVARINVNGHTDLSGSEDYNLKLSLRRANAVKAALMRLGIAGDTIAVLGKDGHEPAIATPPGVREPQNRRAEIVF